MIPSTISLIHNILGHVIHSSQDFFRTDLYQHDIQPVNSSVAYLVDRLLSMANYSRSVAVFLDFEDWLLSFGCFADWLVKLLLQAPEDDPQVC